MADVVRVSAAEFEQLTENDERRFELIEGEIVEMAPAKIVHQRLSRRLSRMVDDLKPDEEVFYAPIEVYLDEYNIPQPDIVWVAANSTCQIEELRLVGVPDLVIEILSSSTAKRDRTTKLSLYEKHGSREYWIVDPEYNQIEVWKRGADSFERQGVYGVGDTFGSTALGGKAVDVSPIFA